ncbi:MAG: GAF domain-containing protein [Verrucomicrobiaceae bacterium]|nr:GAF domain-containing protein [Verrucomicrobiaceae bacterium]
MASLGISPNSKFADISQHLRNELSSIGDQLDAGSFTRILPPLAKNTLLGAFRKIGADHGAIWLADNTGDHLVPVFGCGEHADNFLNGKFKLPTDQGLISMVFATGQPFCENAIHKNPGHSPLLDRQLGVRTEAMIAIPLTFANSLRGIISCVHLGLHGSKEEEKTFSGSDLGDLELASATIAHLLDLTLMEQILGWQDG